MRGRISSTRKSSRRMNSEGLASTMTTRMRTRRRWAFGAPLLAIALAALPFTSPAHALATTDAAATAPQNDDSGQLDARAVRRELDNFQAAQISLRKAMAIAERLHAGSTTADVSFDGGSDPAVFRVKTVQRDRVWRHTINAATGQVIDAEAALPLSELDTEDRGNLVVLRALRHRLADAVSVAERATSGKAISGGLTRERGRLNFVIVVVAGSDLKQVILEPPGARLR